VEIRTVASRQVPLSAGDQADVHLFVDGSVIEMIIGGRESYTRRFYIPGGPDIAVELRGAAIKAQAWSMKAAVI
jgi:beta-fructofuranosidase